MFGTGYVLFFTFVASKKIVIFLADACFEAALQLVSNLPRSVEIEGIPRDLETYLVSYLCNMLATLVVVPVSNNIKNNLFA